jgi:hypothetical protein
MRTCPAFARLLRPRVAAPLIVGAVVAVAGCSPGPSAAARFDWSFDLLTDAATRLARDLKDGASRLASSRGDSIVVVHRMKPEPEGCRHGYRVQLSAASALVVWCRSADGAQTVSSHTTTSHLPAVAVPRTWIVDKAAGEPLRIELTRAAGKPVVGRVD